MTKQNAFRKGVPPVENGLLHQKVASRLRTLIVDDELPPLSRILEKELCEQFGISRTPLREALKILAAEGLVELLPNRGAIVTDATPEALMEKFEVVAVLEGLAARNVCTHASKSQISRLVAKNADMIRYFQANDVARYHKSNIEFHKLLVRTSGNSTIIELHERLIVFLLRARYRSKLSAQLSREFVDDHIALEEAIVAGDADEAERIARAHNNRISSRILKLVRESRSGQENMVPA